MSVHREAIRKIYKMAGQCEGPIRGISQIGEKYDPKRLPAMKPQLTRYDRFLQAALCERPA